SAARPMRLASAVRPPRCMYGTRWRLAVIPCRRRRPPQTQMQQHFHRHHRNALGLLLAVALFGCGHRDTRPNIVLVSIDTLRRDALHAYAPTAQPLPALDRLAADSVRFDRAFSAAAWTLPSHASLLTGTYPHRHGAIHRRATISRTVPSLAGQLFRRG